ncbi:MAG: TetR/AcrR family transcriptional regulator [Nostoc sp. S4]|nr:TetR/AcrR family transcriptional regulator [Nostoc sp. S4]
MEKTLSHQANTYEQIVIVAKELIQTYGYNGFSYADISVRVGIRKATIHYHFPTKSYLTKIVVARYRENFSKKLRDVDRQTDDPHRKIQIYVQMYSDVLKKNDNICLCGMLAAEFTTLPEDVRWEVQKFFSENEEWLTKIIKSIVLLKVADVVTLDESCDQDEAWLLLSVLEGAMLIARTNEGVPRFYSITQRLLKRLDL